MPSLKNFLKLPLAVAIVASLSVPAVPQEPAQGPALKKTVNLVNLFATVRDKNKRIVGDMRQDDFKIFEDGQEQKIAFFSKEVTMPVTLGLLIDTSGSEQNRLGAEQEAASRFMERVMRKGDEAMVISFDTDVDLLADFTDDRAQVERAIQKARIGAVNTGVVSPGTIPTSSNAAGTLFYDAVFLACNDKLVTEAGRKALVIITDADDQGSKLRVEQAIEAAQRTDTVIHILLVHDPGYGWRPDVAREMTDATGGRTLEVSSEKKLNEAFDQISDELRSQYTLGYYPTNTSKDGQFRKVKVETTNKDYKILTRGKFTNKVDLTQAGKRTRVFLTTGDISLVQKILIRTILLCLALYAAPRVVRGQAAAFDLTGPRVETKVSRAGKSLPIAEVANFQAGDRIWIHPDFPESQSVNYLMIVAFLRGSTNPPPEDWFTRAETWNKKVREEGILVTVPKDAQQVLVFLAPDTSGGFVTLRKAVRSVPGVFVRATQDLNQAGLYRSRLEKYLSEIRKTLDSDPTALHERSVQMAKTLQIKIAQQCFDRPVEQQAACLTQNTDRLVLDDGHSQSVVAALTTGPSSDLIGAISTTPMAGGGFYSAYIGAVVDLARLLGNIHKIGRAHV